MSKFRGRPPSMQEVADAAGVHQTTVSRALRNDKRLPPATRERIQAIAEKLGYRPHPLVSALIALRRSRRHPRGHATLAFVSLDQKLGEAAEKQWAGARATAEHHGYKLEHFVVDPARLSEKRLSSILVARNIPGIIIAPFPQAKGHLDLSWNEFCTVVLEYTFTSPAFDRVVHDSYDGMRRIMAECRQRNIKRVGLTLSTIANERTERTNVAAYWAEQKADRFFSSVPPLIQPEWQNDEFERWFTRFRPEIIITSNIFLDNVLAWCEKRGLQLSEDIQLVNVNAFPAKEVSGIVQDHVAIGAIAARLVIEKITRNDRGIPELRSTTLTPGRWFDGNTFSPMKV